MNNYAKKINGIASKFPKISDILLDTDLFNKGFTSDKISLQNKGDLEEKDCKKIDEELQLKLLSEVKKYKDNNNFLARLLDFLSRQDVVDENQKKIFNINKEIILLFCKAIFSSFPIDINLSLQFLFDELKKYYSKGEVILYVSDCNYKDCVALIAKNKDKDIFSKVKIRVKNNMPDKKFMIEWGELLLSQDIDLIYNNIIEHIKKCNL